MKAFIAFAFALLAAASTTPVEEMQTAVAPNMPIGAPMPPGFPQMPPMPQMPALPDIPVSGKHSYDGAINVNIFGESQLNHTLNNLVKSAQDTLKAFGLEGMLDGAHQFGGQFEADIGFGGEFVKAPAGGSAAEAPAAAPGSGAAVPAEAAAAPSAA